MGIWWNKNKFLIKKNVLQDYSRILTRRGGERASKECETPAKQNAPEINLLFNANRNDVIVDVKS
jgi:hypothetical protein